MQYEIKEIIPAAASDEIWKLKRLSRTSPSNHGSRTVSLKMGYKKTGTEKEYLIAKTSILSYLS